MWEGEDNVKVVPAGLGSQGWVVTLEPGFWSPQRWCPVAATSPLLRETKAMVAGVGEGPGALALSKVCQACCFHVTQI